MTASGIPDRAEGSRPSDDGITVLPSRQPSNPWDFGEAKPPQEPSGGPACARHQHAARKLRHPGT